MITVELITRDSDKYCGACNTSRNRSDYLTLKWYQVTRKPNSNNAYIETYCEFCLDELRRKINAAR